MLFTPPVIHYFRDVRLVGWTTNQHVAGHDARPEGASFGQLGNLDATAVVLSCEGRLSPSGTPLSSSSPQRGVWLHGGRITQLANLTVTGEMNDWQRGRIEHPTCLVVYESTVFVPEPWLLLRGAMSADKCLASPWVVYLGHASIGGGVFRAPLLPRTSTSIIPVGGQQFFERACSRYTSLVHNA